MIPIRKQRLRFCSRQDQPPRRGGAATELIVCLPLIAVLLVGAMDACSMLYLKQSLSIASYEGARLATVHRSSAAGAKQQVESILSSRGVNAFQVTISPDVESASVREYVVVTATAPCADNLATGALFYRGRLLTSQVHMMKEF